MPYLSFSVNIRTRITNLLLHFWCACYCYRSYLNPWIGRQMVKLQRVLWQTPVMSLHCHLSGVPWPIRRVPNWMTGFIYTSITMCLIHNQLQWLSQSIAEDSLHSLNSELCIFTCPPFTASEEPNRGYTNSNSSSVTAFLLVAAETCLVTRCPVTDIHPLSRE
jgi:hypothetical protein